MTKKTFADICLERAEKSGPADSFLRDATTDEGLLTWLYASEENLDFIAHARTDVPELSRRLKFAIDWLKKSTDYMHPLDAKVYGKMIDELEKPLEGE